MTLSSIVLETLVLVPFPGCVWIVCYFLSYCRIIFYLPEGSSYREFELPGVENKWPERRENDGAVHVYSYTVHFNCNLIDSGSGRNLPNRN